MFDESSLKILVNKYKQALPERLVTEKYKWEAVKCFQDNWDITATNFAEMLKRSFNKVTSKLVYGQSTAIIVDIFAKNEPETVRKMFEKLFDEDKGVYQRIKDFKESSELLNKKYGSKKEIDHHQRENAISLYLWLRFPDVYCLYKKKDFKIASSLLKYDFNGKSTSNFYDFYDDLCKELKKNVELIKIFQSKLTNDCYPDAELKTLTYDFCEFLHQDYIKFRKDLEKPSNNNNSPNNSQPSNSNAYTKENFLEEVYISAEKYDTLAAILDRKKNIILQGAPGVGKTFAAKRLAYSVIGEKNDSQIEFVQFHQNYSYEDFIMGWRPTENNFELRQGIFYNFCKKAEAAPDKKFFFIIDEINRGNMSKIFGELLMLIEADKRGKEKIKLAYNDESFSVPENLFIIGMMNTADRSLAIIDYALRRRFSFFEMTPAFDSDGFKKYQAALNSEIFDKLIDKIKILNEKISADNSLGAGFCIGHSYFCGLEKCDEKILRSIVDYEILPMLQEYYFDDSATLQDWENILRGVLDD